MDDLSWRRWQEFSERMARTCYADHKKPDLEFILSEVHHFFDCCGKWEIAAFSSWDNSDPYPRESGYFERSRRCECWWRNGGPRPIHNGQSPDCDICGGDPNWLPMSSGNYPCDMVQEMADQAIPFWECGSCRHHEYTDYRRYYASQKAGLDRAQRASYVAWRSAAVPWWPCSCDDDRCAWEEAWLEQWFDPVRCCLRAGIDFAGEASAGVLGFTAGDLRRMWPEGVPDWVFPPDEKLSIAFTSPPVVSGTFADLPDNAGVVL